MAYRHATVDTTREDPLVGFHFSVEINSRRIGAFTECSLPALEWDVETI